MSRNSGRVERLTKFKNVKHALADNANFIIPGGEHVWVRMKPQRMNFKRSRDASQRLSKRATKR